MTHSPPPLRPRILATYPLPEAVTRRLSRFADLTVLAGERDQDRLIALSGQADALICTLMNRIDEGFIGRLPGRIRLIATYSVGYDHVSVEALEHRGIVLVNTPDVLTEATADVAFLLLLGAARRAAEASALLREGRWTGWEPTQLVGLDLAGKTLGLLGFGRIGRAVARRARGFGLKVATVVRDPSRLDGVEDHVRLEDTLEAVLEQSDFVSLHLPLTEETQGLIDRRRLSLMKPGAVLVNTARGGLIDEAALVEALESGRLAAAGLDVFAGEPAVNPALLAAPNTFLLPHIGSATQAAREAMGLSLASDIEAFFQGRAPANPVRRRGA